MNSIYEEDFLTSLGSFGIRILSDSSRQKPASVGQKSTDVVSFESKTYLLKILRRPLDLQLSNGAKLSKRMAWCFNLVKTRREHERLQILFELLSDNPDVFQGPNSGEGLTAASYHDGKYQIHLGTEDSDVQKYRATVADGIPTRYAKYLGLNLTNKTIFIESFTEYTKQGLSTRLPNLRLGERAYFHFVIAEKPYEEDNCDTWLAVDMSKKHLLEGYPDFCKNAHSLTQ